MVEGSNPSGPAIRLHAEPAAHDLRLNEGGPVDSEKGPLLDLEARLAKPCLFPFDGEPYRLTECCTVKNRYALTVNSDVKVLLKTWYRRRSYRFGGVWK